MRWMWGRLAAWVSPARAYARPSFHTAVWPGHSELAFDPDLWMRL